MRRFSIDKCKIQAIVSLIPEAVVKMDDKDLDDTTGREELDRYSCSA